MQKVIPFRCPGSYSLCFFIEWSGEEAQIPTELWVDLFRMTQEILGSLQGGEPLKDARVALAQAAGCSTLSVRVQGEEGALSGFLRTLEATGLRPWVASIHGQVTVRQQRGPALRVSVRVPGRLPPAAGQARGRSVAGKGAQAPGTDGPASRRGAGP